MHLTDHRELDGLCLDKFASDDARLTVSHRDGCLVGFMLSYAFDSSAYTGLEWSDEHGFSYGRFERSSPDVIRHVPGVSEFSQHHCSFSLPVEFRRLQDRVQELLREYEASDF